MGIQYQEKNRIFKLDTPHSTYMIGIVDEEQFVSHIYYGKKVEDPDLTHLLRISESIHLPSVRGRERVSFMDGLPVEYSTQSVGDFRESCLSVRTEGGHSACQIAYQSHKIYGGKPALEGLPATFGGEEDCTTLEIRCVDKVLDLEVVLVYTVFEKLDAITRSARIRNCSEKDLFLTKALSFCLDMDQEDYDVLTLPGLWTKERMMNRRPITPGKISVDSIRGESSHQQNPFLAVLEKDANQDRGNVYGFNLVYSGNFMAQAEETQFQMLRVSMGISPDDFAWKLSEGETFTVPEAVLVFSGQGLTGMTHTFHDLYRNHLIRGKYKDMERPVLINNWEATYFNFNTEKLLSIAREAARSGIEMLVLDDGWFGKRDDDNSGLGDWFVNEEKLPGGLSYLVEEVNKLGLKFGLWFEPEMVSPDSDLYRAHPDWAIQVPGRTPALQRCQLVLDLTRKEVRDGVYSQVYKVLKSANIEYVKWDMNRSLTDIGSLGLSPECQGEFFHRYVLGVYDLQNRLVTDFPDLLLENCSSGGGRFDPGMLYYSPQIWCSDNTDAIDRLAIQEGTALVYPLSTMGAHVADCPSHSTGRTTPFETRGLVAMAGTFGYELDITRISGEDRSQIPGQVAMYHELNGLVRAGDYYRIASYQENREYDCWEVVSKDRSEALVTYIQVTPRCGLRTRRIHLRGLEEKSLYEVSGMDKPLTGGALMYAGIQVQNMSGDYRGKMIRVKKK